MADNCRNIIWVGFAAGLLVGLAVGVISAPNSGFETRAIIKAKAHEAGRSTAGAIERLKTQMQAAHDNRGAC